MKSFILVLAIIAVTACSADEQVAERIRAAQSELVQEVFYHPGNLLDSPEVIVYLRPGATEEQARDFWCSIVVPAGGSKYEGEQAVTLWNDSGSEPMAIDLTCPSASS